MEKIKDIIVDNCEILGAQLVIDDLQILADEIEVEIKKINKIKQIKDWNKADEEGNINVPDHLDVAIARVGNQLRLHTISGKNEVQTICDIVYGLESYFEELYSKNKRS